MGGGGCGLVVGKGWEEGGGGEWGKESGRIGGGKEGG